MRAANKDSKREQETDVMKTYGAIAEEDAIRLQFHDLLCWVVGRNHGDLAAK